MIITFWFNPQYCVNTVINVAFISYHFGQYFQFNEFIFNLFCHFFGKLIGNFLDRCVFFSVNWNNFAIFFAENHNFFCIIKLNKNLGSISSYTHVLYRVNMCRESIFTSSNKMTCTNIFFWIGKMSPKFLIKKLKMEYFLRLPLPLVKKIYSLNYSLFINL
jgi:hypothetical protein